MASIRTTNTRRRRRASCRALIARRNPRIDWSASAGLPLRPGRRPLRPETVARVAAGVAKMVNPLARAMTSPIRTEAENEAAIARIERIWDSRPGTPESAEFDALAAEIERFEEVAYPMDPPTPEQATAFRRDQEKS